MRRIKWIHILLYLYLLSSPSMAKIQLPSIKLAFTADIAMGISDIFLLERLEDEPINLTRNSSSSDWSPRWSPDGRRIAFLSERDGSEELYIMDVKTRRVSRITHNSMGNAYPAWSPDGRRIALLSMDEGRWKIRLINLLSGESKFLTDGSSVCAFDWMPDGKKLILGCREPKGFFVLDTTKEGEREIGELEKIPIPHDLTYIYSVACSKNGKKVAYSVCKGMFGVSDIYIMNLEDGSVKNLSKISGKPFHANDDFPRWTPDGRFIIFASDREANRKGYDIYIMTSDGEIVERLNLAKSSYHPDVFDPNYAYSVSSPIDLKKLTWGMIKRGVISR
ncbi:PD40 domain-containing protein [Candidatus Poribacteria bacterium]|nr:PD40 domain-containing protein [Candidatus Poribacteria bacterium]